MRKKKSTSKVDLKTVALIGVAGAAAIAGISYFSNKNTGGGNNSGGNNSGGNNTGGNNTGGSNTGGGQKWWEVLGDKIIDVFNNRAEKNNNNNNNQTQGPPILLSNILPTPGDDVQVGYGSFSQRLTLQAAQNAQNQNNNQHVMLGNGTDLYFFVPDSNRRVIQFQAPGRSAQINFETGVISSN